MLPLTVLLVTTFAPTVFKMKKGGNPPNVPELARPPPELALLLRMVQSVSVVVLTVPGPTPKNAPAVHTPPPLPVAVLPLTVQLVSEVVP